MLEHGFVKFHREITSWGWYKNINTFKLFFHLLLTANYEEQIFEGLPIKRGQRVASRITLAQETGLTEREVRTAIKHLEKTGEVTSSRYAKFTVFTINQYEAFVESPNQMPDNRPADDQQMTKERPQCKKEQESKRKKKNCDTSTQAYGEYRNVRLTDAQYARLIGEYGEHLIRTYIRRIDEWIQLRGEKPYKDFSLAIRNWIRRDNAQKEREDAAYERFQGTAAAEGFI